MQRLRRKSRAELDAWEARLTNISPGSSGMLSMQQVFFRRSALAPYDG
ncbi:hypothetical protein ABIA45_005111 [Bradyrhizobium sp. USDA 336]